MPFITFDFKALPGTFKNVKADLLKFKTLFHSVGLSVAGGAANSGYQLLSHADQEMLLFTHVGRIKLLHAFGAGAGLALLGWFLPSPLKQTLDQLSNKKDA